MAWHIVQPHHNKLNLKIKYIKDKVHAESADIPREKYILKGGLNG